MRTTMHNADKLSDYEQTYIMNNSSIVQTAMRVSQLPIKCWWSQTKQQKSQLDLVRKNGQHKFSANHGSDYTAEYTVMNNE